MKIGQYCQASIVSDNVVSTSNWSNFWQAFASRGLVSDSWAFLYWLGTCCGHFGELPSLFIQSDTKNKLVHYTGCHRTVETVLQVLTNCEFRLWWKLFDSIRKEKKNTITQYYFLMSIMWHLVEYCWQTGITQDDVSSYSDWCRMYSRCFFLCWVCVWLKNEWIMLCLLPVPWTRSDSFVPQTLSSTQLLWGLRRATKADRSAAWTPSVDWATHSAGWWNLCLIFTCATLC